MNHPTSRLRYRQIVEIFARLSVVLDRPIEMLTILLLVQQREQGINRRTDIANEIKAKLRISPDFHRICLSLRLLPLSKVITFAMTASLFCANRDSRRSLSRFKRT